MTAWKKRKVLPIKVEFTCRISNELIRKTIATKKFTDATREYIKICGDYKHICPHLYIINETVYVQLSGLRWRNECICSQDYKFAIPYRDIKEVRCI